MSNLLPCTYLDPLTAISARKNFLKIGQSSKLSQPQDKVHLKSRSTPENYITYAEASKITGHEIDIIRKLRKTLTSQPTVVGHIHADDIQKINEYIATKQNKYSIYSISMRFHLPANLAYIKFHKIFGEVFPSQELCQEFAKYLIKALNNSSVQK
jgi:hypothetical protein